MPDTVYGFFEKSAKEFPNKDFQRAKDRDGIFQGTTYAQAYNTVFEIGTGLMSLGVNYGDRVALICDNRPEWILINLALQGIGAPDVPRDVDVPLEQLVAILDDSRSKFLIVENQKALEKVYEAQKSLGFQISGIVVIEKEPKKREGVFSLEDIVKEGRTQLALRNDIFSKAKDRITPDDISTIVYTSGTEGIPKGTILTNANFDCQLDKIPPLLNLNENERVLSFLPPWHLLERIVDYMVFAIGGSLSYTTQKDIMKDIVLEKPTFIASVPRVWTRVYERVQKDIQRKGPKTRALANKLLKGALEYKRARNTLARRYPDSPDHNSTDMIKAAGTAAKYFAAYRAADLMIFSRLRKMLGGELKGAIFGGAHLPEHVEDFLDAAGLDVLEAYGMTEAAPVVTVRLFGGTLYTAGKPIPGTEVQIFDRYLQKVEPGEQGVVYARGPQIMRGYTDEEKTRKVLSPATDGGKSWYNTGDLGVITPNGDLIIKGRLGDNFKLSNSQWITPQPIEDLINQSKYVSEAMVVGLNQEDVRALIWPSWDAVIQYARQEKIEIPDDPEQAREALAENEKIIELIKKDIIKRWHAEQDRFMPYEEPVKFAIIPDELTVGAGLTATLKIKRADMMERYRKPIADLYKPSK